MKKILGLCGVVCMLVSGQAMAQTQTDCPDGVLQNVLIDAIDFDGVDCVITGVNVKGQVEIINGANVSIQNSNVGGRLRIRDVTTEVEATDNRVFKGNMIVNENENAYVLGNEIMRGDLRVRNNTNAVVAGNTAAKDARCGGNTTLDAFLNSHGVGFANTCD